MMVLITTLGGTSGSPAHPSSSLLGPSPLRAMIEASLPDTPVPSLRVGDTLAERYILTQPLGAGGYSTVFAARDQEGGFEVAVKILKTQGEHNDPSALARMRQEATLLRSIDHPHVVTIHDFLEEDGFAFLVMEKLSGFSLARLLMEHGPSHSDRVLPMVRQLLDALAAAHDKKILHRDIKPENILICPTSDGGEAAKLVDFGLAKTFAPRDGDEDSLEITLVETKEGGFMGTPRYTPPEQALGDPMGPYTDLFALGLVIAEWLTGVVRMDDEVHADLMRNLVGPTPIDVADCPRPWRAWLRRLLDKNPEARPQTARAADALLEEMVIPELSGARRDGVFAFDEANDTFVPADLVPDDDEEDFEVHSPSFLDRDEDEPLELDLERVANVPESSSASLAVPPNLDAHETAPTMRSPHPPTHEREDPPLATSATPAPTEAPAPPQDATDPEVAHGDQDDSSIGTFIAVAVISCVGVLVLLMAVMLLLD